MSRLIRHSSNLGARRPLEMSSAARRSRPGFTLIELLVVIAIIAILAAMLLPVFAVARERARRNQCSTNLGKIGTALSLYQLDQGGFPPDLNETGANTPAKAWHAGFLLLLGRSSGYAKANPTDPLNSQTAYLSDEGDLHCLDNQDTNQTDVSTTSGSASGSYAEGYDNYDAPDPYGAAAWPGNLVSAYKYSRRRLTANDYGSATWPTDYSNPHYTRQLRFLHPDADTVVTWCTQHRSYDAAGNPQGKNDLVLFLDGKVLVKSFLPFSSDGGAPGHFVRGNGLILETDS